MQSRRNEQGVVTEEQAGTPKLSKKRETQFWLSLVMFEMSHTDSMLQRAIALLDGDDDSQEIQHNLARMHLAFLQDVRALAELKSLLQEMQDGYSSEHAYPHG